MSKFYEAGKKLAGEQRWRGKDICKVFINALTDANFHSLRKLVVKAVNKQEGWKLHLEG